MTEPYYSDDLVTLHHGDCLDVLLELPDASVDAVVTDPPYGLEFMGKEWDGANGFRRSLNPNDAGRDNAFGRTPRTSPEYRTASKAQASRRQEGGISQATGPSFLGGLNPKCLTCDRWQRGSNPCTCPEPVWTQERIARLHTFQEWCEAWAIECFRVLRPGGHMLAFGGSRTWHRLTVAVEDAGFEVRDSIAWLYGSGFPKSLDVSKAIDKRRTEDLEPIRTICRAIRGAMDTRDLRSRDLVEHFDGCHPRLIDHWAARDTDSQPSLPTWEQWETLTALFADLAEHDAEVWRLNGRKGSPGDAWDAREITGTVDEWTDRVNYALTSRDGLRRDNPATDAAREWQGWGTALKPAFEPIVVARKPLAGTVAANVLEHRTGALNIDGCRIEHASAADLAESTGKNQHARFGTAPGQNNVYGDYAQTEVKDYDGTGGRWPANVVLDEAQAAELDATSDLASRFFYTAKAGSDERVHLDGVAHPTVKPLALMRWLVRLVTPPGGVVLEPFAGSGTTVEACLLEGFRCVAIEREADYLPLIRQRLHRRIDPVAAVRASGHDGGLFDLLTDDGEAS